MIGDFTFIIVYSRLCLNSYPLVDGLGYELSESMVLTDRLKKGLKKSQKYSSVRPIAMAPT